MKKHISLILIFVLLAAILVGCGGSGYKDGTYKGEGKGMEALEVEVTVEDGKIADVIVIQHNETEGFCEKAIEEIPQAIVEANSPEVDAISNSTKTSEGIMEAVENALEEAK